MNVKTVSAKSVTRLPGALAVLIGGLVLTGWALDIGALKSILPGWVSMKPNTALAFVLTGIALLCAKHPGARLGRLCGGLAGLIGLLTLVEYVSGWNPGFDQWLFREAAGTVGTSYPGRMAPDSALCFVLLAAGLEAARTLRRRNRMLFGTVLLGALTAVLALATMLAYFTPGLGAFGWCGLTIMAVPTAALFAALGGALVLLVWPEVAESWALGTRHTSAYTGALVLALFIGLTSSRSVLWMADSARQVSRAQRVAGAIERVMSDVAKAQSHTRGYVIVGGEQYLQSVELAAARCRDDLAALRHLISDPSQQARSDRLETQVSEVLQHFSKVIATRSTGGAGAVQPDMVNRGEALVGSLRALIEEMEDGEVQLIHGREELVQKVAMFTQGTIVTGTLVSVIGFLLVLIGLNRNALRELPEVETTPRHRS
jgi:CHASE3 domain sensor protein